ncbi:folate-binding protein [bacterium]|nr:folate-binding protein [bacterium]
MFICHPTTLMNSELLQKIKSPVGPWIPGPRALLRLTGEDRVRFLNGQVTQDLKKLQPGQAVRAAIITSKGRLEADTRIAATADALLLETDLSLRESIRSRLEKFIVADDVAIEDLSESFYLAHFSGLNQPPGGCPAESFSFQCARFREPGADLWIPTSSNWATASSSAKDWEPLRIARGLPLWSVDVGPDTLPPEAGFETDAISSTKGCYIGQEVISRLRSVGHVNRHLCVLGTDQSLSSPSGDCTSQDGTVLGKITSSTPLDHHSGCIALAMIKREQAQPGNSVLAGGAVWTILRHA